MERGRPAILLLIPSVALVFVPVSTPATQFQQPQAFVHVQSHVQQVSLAACSSHGRHLPSPAPCGTHRPQPERVHRHAKICVSAFPGAHLPAAAATFIRNLPRPLLIWVVILSLATLAKNVTKRKGPKKLKDSGECPFPFIFFHDPVDGFKKHKGKVVLCIGLWAFVKRKLIYGWVACRLWPT